MTRRFSFGGQERLAMDRHDLQPPCITVDLYRQARDQAARKLSQQSLASCGSIVAREGKAAQILHVGPFSEEGPTISDCTISLQTKPQTAPASITNYTE